MPRAAVLLRTSDYYRADQFCEGLHRHGFEVSREWKRQPDRRDVLLLWNRNRGYETIANIYERAGARVIVAENGYLGQPAGGGKFYALALDQHNGAGRWFVGDAPRFEIAEQPWRGSGEHVLVLPQRGIGAQGVAMPGAWLKGIQRRLAAITDRPIRIRQHPGASKADPTPDFRDAHCAVTWGSGAGIKAIQAGVPVFHELDKWIGGCAASLLGSSIESCDTPSRGELWRRISWAQWSLAEVGSGEAFDQLLNAKDRDLLCSGHSPLGSGGRGDEGWRDARRRAGDNARVGHVSGQP